MKKMRKHIKKALCIALIAVMLFTSTSMTVFAEKNVQVEETQQDFEAEEDSKDKVTVEEELTEETPNREETMEQIYEEKDFDEETKESTLIEKISNENDKQIDNKDTLTDGVLTEKTKSEVISHEDSANAEETEVSENEMKLTFSDTDIAHGEYNNITWVIDKDGKLTVEGTGNFAPLNDKYHSRDHRAPWSWEGSNIKTAEINVQRMTDASYMFSGCYQLTTVDLSNFDTGNITDMYGMFSECSRLTSLDLSNFDTRNVIDMGYMFSDCSSLTSLDLSNFNTGNITDMSCMFVRCSNLASLDISGFDTGNVTNMEGMFAQCDCLTSIDVSGFNTAKVTDMSGMFLNYSSNLTNLDVSGFDTRNVTNMGQMFYGCENLTNLDVSGFNTENVTDMGEMFYGCRSLTNLDVSGFDTRNVTNMSYMFGVPWDVDDRQSNLISLDVSSFDTRNVTNMSHMFARCKSLTGLDVSSFNTENVTDMSYMFYGCNSLTNLDVSGFNTKNVTNMKYMFQCPNISSLNVRGFITRKVTDMYGMFSGCSSLSILDLNGFDTGNVTDMTWMFSNCSGLTRLDVSNFNTENVTDMSGMFSNCSSLTGLDVSSFNTGNVTDMGSMFFSCSSLTNLDLSSFNTISVTNMSSMFRECSSLTNLDLSSFNTENATDMKSMLDYCKNLILLYTPRNLAVSVSFPGNELVERHRWYDLSGNEYTKLPTQSNNSILLASYTVPTTPAVRIVATKTKTNYSCGEKIFLQDLRVLYYDTDGTVKVLEGSEYTTNLADIDTLIAGKQILTVAYNELSVNVVLIISEKEEDDDTEESSSTEESSKVEESGGIESSKTEESSCTESSWMEEGSTVEESNASEESSKIEESNISEESSEMEEGSSTEESSKTEESSSTGESSTEDKDDSPYEDKERTDLKYANTMTGNIKAEVYDGDAYEPVVKVTATIGKKKITLTEGADYRVLYKNNVNAGIGTVIIRGNGAYKGEIRKPLIITQKPINKLKIITGSIVGTDSISKLPIHVYDGAKLLQRDKDYTLSDYKTVKDSLVQVTVNAVQNGNYIGSTVAKFTVYEGGTKVINSGNVKLKEATVPYTGKAVKPEVVVTVDGILLTNRNYKVQYQNNKNAGTAYVIVTGKGTYKGKAVIPFTIKTETVANANDFTIKEIKEKTYNGKLQKPVVNVTIQKNGKAKKLSKKDYIVTYKNNLHAGEANVTVTGKGNYAGLSATAKFTIKPQQIKKISLKGTRGNLVLMYNKRKLREGTDYEKPEYGSVNKNKVSVAIKGKGDFAGEITKTVKVQ